MTLLQWFIFFLIVQAVHFAGTWKLYVKAGRKAWEAAVPVYNAVILMGIINRSKWWTILLFIPIVNLIIIPVVWVETARSFGFTSYKDTALTIFTLGFYLYYINYATDTPHRADRDINPKSSSGEWTSSLLFAIVAATIVHTYFMQPFVIPTSSLEKTLLVGDWLFVSKFHYGARAPLTTVATPMLHDTIYGTKTKSYLSKPQLPYFRLPGFQNIKNNDIVVFSWPVDTLVDISVGSMRGSVRKPIDKKSNYVKRAVGIAGDSLEVRDGYVYINGKKNELPDRARIQFQYEIKSKDLLVKRATDARGNYVFPTDLTNDRYEISDIYLSNVEGDSGPYTHMAHASEAAIEKLKNNSNIISITRTKYDAIENNKSIFGHKPGRASSVDSFGPIYIPEAGKTVAITPKSLPYYERIIEVYEGYEMGEEREITVNGNQILLNGQELSEYTFKQNYYWMMGDNRHNSQDARTWGYVPFNHVVGKPVFVWLSLDANKNGFLNSIRWDRVFTTVGGNGPLVSYRYWFLGALLLYIGWSFFKKKKKSKVKK